MHPSPLSSRPWWSLLIWSTCRSTTAVTSRTGLSRCDTRLCRTIHINNARLWQCTRGKQPSSFLTWSCQHFQGLLNVMRLGICVWCSVTYSALICVYCSSYLSCVAAFSLPDIDIHCRSCAAPWAMWINTANTTPLKRHNPFCFGAGSFSLCMQVGKPLCLYTLTRTHARTRACIHMERYKQTRRHRRTRTHTHTHTHTHFPLSAHFPFQKLLSIYRLWYVNLWNLTSGKTIRPVLLQSAGIKRQKGEQKNRWEKRNTKETQCKKREAEACLYYGVDNYSQRQGRLGQRFHQMLPEEETDRGGDVFYFWTKRSHCLPSLCIKRAGRCSSAGGGGKEAGDLSWDGAPNIWDVP